MTDNQKGGLKQLSPIDIYSLLPKTNCKECGEDNCMAFATKLVNREVNVEQCTPLKDPKYKKNYAKLAEMLKPAVKEVTIGVGERAVKIGGKLVMYRHELTYTNPTAIAIDVTDEMTAEEISSRVNFTQDFSYIYIGNNLQLQMIAIRSTSNDAEKFKATVKKVSEQTDLPIILCSYDSAIVESGLMAIPKARPLLYAATKDNWKEMAELALMYNCPLVVSAPNDISLLRSLVKTMIAYGVEDVVLDPGTFANAGLGETINNFTMIRRAACNLGDELLAHPTLATPITAWTEPAQNATLTTWKEAQVAAMLVTRYADAMIIHAAEGWSLLPLTVLRQNIYTDPRKPVAVKAEMVAIGTPDENSPVLMTSNFALTYYTVAQDIESSGNSVYLIVVDSEGTAIDSGVAGRKMTAETIADAIKESGVEDKVKHRKLIIPGKAARLSGEIEELSKWDVMVGPQDSSGIAKFLQDKWK
ncbi:MAG: acetyl-CoA decarbonylase/synthase complex subunit gamma [Candidatus Bathyarchaeota archaeon]|nr:MAG: acetyl-CoA decarbonylase/synthase complex subunit gamma [Candidatus Bathyarchaeota archaeon]